MCSTKTLDIKITKPRKGLFLCERASAGYQHEKPCVEAFEVFVLTNIEKPEVCKRWVVELNDIYDLLYFIEKHGECIIGRDAIVKDFNSITIYDDYVE